MVKEVENVVPWSYDISNLYCGEKEETFNKKELKKTNQTDLKKLLRQTEKLSKREEMSNRKVMIILLIVGLIKISSFYKMSFFRAI